MFFLRKLRKIFQKEDVLVFCAATMRAWMSVLEEIVTDCVSIGDYVLTGGRTAGTCDDGCDCQTGSRRVKQ